MLTAILGPRGLRLGRAVPAVGLSHVSAIELVDTAATIASDTRSALAEVIVRVSAFSIASRPVDVALPGGFVTERWRPVRGYGIVSDDVHAVVSYGAAGKALGVPLRVALLSSLTPVLAAACLAAGIDEVWVGANGPLSAVEPELDAEPFRRLDRLGPSVDARERVVFADGAADPARTALAILALAEGGRRVRLVTTSRQLFEALPAQLSAALAWPSAGALDPRLDEVVLQLAAGLEVALSVLAAVRLAEVHVTGSSGLLATVRGAGVHVHNAAPVGLDRFLGAAAPDPREFLVAERAVVPDGELTFRVGAAASQFAAACGNAAAATLLDVAAPEPIVGESAPRLPESWLRPGMHLPVAVPAAGRPTPEALALFHAVLARAATPHTIDARAMVATRLWLPADSVLVVVGRVAAWNALAACLLVPGATAAVPAYEDSTIVAAIAGTGAHLVRLPPSAEDALELDVAASVAASTAATVVALSSPGLETGRAMHPRLLRLFKTQSEAMLLVDEGLASLGGQDFRLFLESGRVVLVRPLSFATARAGFDVVVLLGPAAILHAVAARLPATLDPVAQAAVAVWAAAPDADAAVVTSVRKARAELADAIAQTGQLGSAGEGPFVLVQTADVAAELASAAAAGDAGHLRLGAAGRLRIDV